MFLDLSKGQQIFLQFVQVCDCKCHAFFVFVFADHHQVH